MPLILHSGLKGKIRSDIPNIKCLCFITRFISQCQNPPKLECSFPHYRQKYVRVTSQFIHSYCMIEKSTQEAPNHLKLPTTDSSIGQMKVSTLKQESISKSFETKKQWKTFWNALLARQGIIAYLPIIVINLLMFYFTSWQFLWLNTDPARYQCYALAYWLGSSGLQLLPATQCSFLHISAAVQ